MENAPVIWRRLGKEHGEDDGCRVNPPDIVEHHLSQKAEKARSRSQEDWPWEAVSEGLLIERSEAEPAEGTTNFCLPDTSCMVIQNSTQVAGWPWYVHIGTTVFDARFDCWVFTDLFADILVAADLKTHTVLHLDDLAEANRIGLIDEEGVRSILKSTQAVVDVIREGAFPPVEIRAYV